MTKKLFITAIAIAASFGISSAQANELNDSAATSDNLVTQSGVSSDAVKCKGWDGSSNGVVKKMSRGDCLGQHGVVVTQDATAPAKAVSKKK